MKMVAPVDLEPMIDFVKAHRSRGVVMAGCALAGLILGILRSSGSASAPDLDERWTLPERTQSAPSALSEELLTNAFWTEAPRAVRQKTPSQPAKKVELWTFIGTVDQGSSKQAVIALENGKIQRLVIGDALPDGSIISGIGVGQLTFDREGTLGGAKLFLEKKPQ
jgi:hypothetical protein